MKLLLLLYEMLYVVHVYCYTLYYVGYNVYEGVR